MKQPSIVLALGGGGARGLAHIGVLAALDAAGIPVRAIVGTSIGAEVGGFVAAGVAIEELKRIAFEVDWLDTMRLFVPSLGSGALTDGDEIEAFLRPWLGGKRIEDAPIGYAAVATDLETGEEVVIQRGEILSAVRASISFPGLIAPTLWQGRRLADGGIVNPVPFDVARRLFGGPVVAVYVHPRPGVRLFGAQKQDDWSTQIEEALNASWLARVPRLKRWLHKAADAARRFYEDRDEEAGIIDVLTRAQIASEDMLVKLRERLAPADLVIAPDVHEIGLLEFYRGKEAFDAGFAAATQAMPRLRALLEGDAPWWRRWFSFGQRGEDARGAS